MRPWDAVILAAGRGTRMGGPKALLDLGGARLLDLQLRALRGARQIAVVLTADLWEGLQPRLPEPRSQAPGLDQLWEGRGTTPVLNPRPEEGPFISIRLGLAALAGDAPALIVPVDCPVPPEGPEALVPAAAPGLAWVSPVRNGRRGHPVLLTPQGRAAALDAPEDWTLRDLLAGYPGVEIPLESPLVHCNLNTPADRDRFLRENPDWPDGPEGAPR